jgi:hypothetical protein
MIQVPLPTALITPLLLTVATKGSEDDHLTVVFEAFVGFTVALMVFVLPTQIVASLTERAIEVTGCFTVTAQDLEIPEPSAALQVIVQVPAALAVITP